MRTLGSALIVLLIALWLIPEVGRAQIVGSKHDLSVGGEGPVKAFGEDEICIFCHAPHTKSPTTPLWNRALSNLVYTTYSSTTSQALPGQPTGNSKLCLSCHDGTIALGAVLGRADPITMTGPLTARTDLTTDLSDDHPISFPYDLALAVADRELVDPAMLTGSVRLDASGELQCTSCHDAHSNRNGDFLVMGNSFSALCTTCHDKQGWIGSAHETAPATWNGIGEDPWPHTELATVAENACASCHRSHAAGSAERLLNHLLEEDNCLVCHDGEVAATDLTPELGKAHAHRVGSTLGAHDPEEDFGSMPRHVECEDCHNPHFAVAGRGLAPDVSGPLLGVAGLSDSGNLVEISSFQYEVCFRCHADSSNAPLPAIQRQVLQANIRLKLSQSNPSFHPVEGPGRNQSVPSLISPLSESSVVYCTDCHTNDQGPSAGGAGPSGPHGSNWSFLLEREYRVGNSQPESAQAYALCYKCHSRASILNDEGFAEHRRHIERENAPCSVCHDPHGISSTQGTSTNHSHLINFDTAVVLPNPGSNQPRFTDLGFQQGSCDLLCHGEEHKAKDYGR